MSDTASDSRPTMPTLRDLVGAETLARLQRMCLSYLGTGAAIFERDGTCVCAEFPSQYCDLLRRASRQLAQSPADGVSRQDLCCRAGWATARHAMITERPAHGACCGGVLLYACPIIASGAVVGANMVVVGAPPRDPGCLQAVAESFGLAPALLRAAAESHPPTSAHVHEAAERHIKDTADLIGGLVAARCDAQPSAPRPQEAPAEDEAPAQQQPALAPPMPMIDAPMWALPLGPASAGHASSQRPLVRVGRILSHGYRDRTPTA